ncbi:PEP-CTERM sorting domain-containing protein [Nodularia sp. NIES-3585]|uniref:PEP-CTERM sorting domain-containing protein n=1 Tax=Nodularia sp. NIES-3585 TaxID=1973477 RepID=UPI000B5CE293|nr:PEP-CTERM sorting domain-containing protein [Nodularia sp. NIES-3585]GAX34146.1 hypothetical protein NIES3585_01450 [Nodularia sp. NIES-3585]
MANVNVLTKLSLATGGAAVLALSVSGTAQAASGFSGSYAPSNWTLTNITTQGNAGAIQGSVDTTNTPLSISITGSDSGAFDFASGQTAYTTIAAASGDVSFDWSYSTNDFIGANSDPFGFILNGVFTQLTSGNASTQSVVGSTFSVNAGERFGFAVQTFTNTFGAATATITNFQAPETPVPTPVPEPASLIGLLGLGAFGVTSVRKRKQQATVKA